MVFALFAVARFLNISADVDNTGYTVFHKAPYDPVYSDTTPASSEIISQGGYIGAFAAKGETEPVTFSVRSMVDLGEMAIDISDLVSGGNTISKNNIDLSNIKIWEQCGPTSNWLSTWYQGCNSLATSNPLPSVQKVMVPELIVKDNEQNYAAEPEGWQSQVGYKPLKANEQFRANISQGATHTFYLNIKTPEEALPGDYTATVNLKPQFGQAKHFNLKLQVLPFKLPEPNKDVGVHLTYGLADEGEISYGKISREKYSKYLDLVRQSGITNVILHFTEYDQTNPYKSKRKLEWLADEIKERNFRATFIWFSGSALPEQIIKRNNEIIKSRNFDVYIYGIDEPNDPTKIAQQLSFDQRVRSQGGLVTTSLKKECADYLANNRAKLDLPIYRIGPYGSESNCPGGEPIQDYVTRLQGSQGQKSSAKEYYYYQIWPEQLPQAIEQYWWGTNSYIRSMTGFFLYKSGLDGIMPFGMDYVLSSRGNKEYSDYDGTYKETRNIYQTEQGWLKTLQFEAFREGIDDLRYAAKFDQVISELNTLDASQAMNLQSQVNGRLSGYKFSGSLGRDVPVYTDEEQQANRRFIADKIIEAERLIKAHSREYSFQKGYTVFGATATFSSLRFTQSGMSVFRYLPSQNKWEEATGSRVFPIEENKSYFVYNPFASRSLFLPHRSYTNSIHQLSKGWNLLYNSASNTPDTLNVKLTDVTMPINGWIGLNRISEYVFVVEDQTQSDPCNYYSLFSSNSNPVGCDSNNLFRKYTKKQNIDPEKSFWVFVN